MKFIHIPKNGGTMIKTHFSIPKMSKKNLTHNPVWNYQLKDDDFLFTMIRNPYDRLVSVYEFLKRGGNGVRDRRYKRRLNLESSCYEELVKYLYKTRRRLLKILHLRPQMYFITDVELYDYIARYEKFSSEIKVIEFLTGLEEKEQEVVNKTKHEHFSTYYNEEIADMVYDMYKCDFKILEYDKDSWRMK